MTENTARRTHAPSRRAIEAEESAGGSIPGRPRSHTPEGSFFRSAVERRAVFISRNGGEEPLSDSSSCDDAVVNIPNPAIGKRKAGSRDVGKDSKEVDSSSDEHPKKPKNRRSKK